jgi:hypothetical protein
MASVTELDPISKFNTLLSSSSFLFLICKSFPSSLLPPFPNQTNKDYRGHWCPWCISYLSTLQALSPLISSSGGKTLAITSEPSSFLSLTREKSGYEGEVMVDTENILAGYLRGKGWVDIVVQEGWVLEMRGYSKGMAQPGVLVIQKKKDGEEVLESWAIVPSLVCAFLFSDM